MRHWARLVVATSMIAAGSFAGSTTAAPVPLMATSDTSEFINNDLTEIVSAEEHTCVIREGSVWCWGRNGGRLGNGEDLGRLPRAAKVSTSASQPGFTNTNATSLTVGYQRTCAIEGGVVYCWGSNSIWDGFRSWNVFGDGVDSGQPRLRPVRIADGEAGNNQVTKVVGGWDHTCFIKLQTLYCWGENSQGQLGDGTITRRAVPTRVTQSATQPGFTNTRVTDVALTGDRTCAVEDGSVYCWGRDQSGALGHGNIETNTALPTPTKVTVSATQPGFTNTNVTLVSTGGVSCAREASNLYCWGFGRSARPSLLEGGDGFINSAVTAMANGMNCAVSQGSAFCWGNNGDGNLGDGTFTSRAAPTRVTNSAAVDNFANDAITAISGQGGTTCVLREGVAYCWGANYHGQLGNLTGFDHDGHYPAGSPFPVRVAGAIAAPGQPTANAGDEQATIMWAAVGGVLEYTVTGSPAGGCTAAAPTTSCTITGLANGIAHTFTVTASVSGRSSPASLASAAVTPTVASPPMVPPPVLTRLTTERITAPAASVPVALSQRIFTPGVSVVYLATRRTLVDALVAGPAAGAGGGPVFTVGPRGLDDVTAAEIRRLQPSRIVIMGGEDALPPTLDASVTSQLGVTPRRIDGTDRYATAAQLSAANHPARTQVVYIATGELLVDAVAGGPAAGIEQAPVLLVRPHAIPEVTHRELRRLRPDRIVILGQTQAVSADVENALAGYARTVERIGGSDRYDTAVEVSRRRFPAGAEVAYLAADTDHSWAAAAVPAATVERGPVLFTRATCLPGIVRSELERLSPRIIRVLGSTGGDPLRLPPC
jgi:putative cell wall-binding protein/alpha-tubulin suppressor-like RCC1 family protein